MIVKNFSKKIASRIGRINFLFLGIILAVVTAVSIWMFLGITDDASKTQARLYSAEAVDILGSQLDWEITSLRHAANSEEIIEWFSDEHNIDKKAKAYDRIMSYTGFFPENSLHFVIHNSLNEYLIEGGAPPEELVPFNVISLFNTNDNWYRTIDSGQEYFLNMDVDNISNTRRLWINYKVTDNEKFLGILCSSLQFDLVFFELFRNYDSKSVIGYIIDNEGYIKIDSSKYRTYFSEIDNNLLKKESNYLHIDNAQNILEVCPTPESISVVIEYLSKTGSSYENLRIDPKVISLTEGNYRYMSIAPIPNTDWSTVTLYNSQSLFSFTRLLPPVIVILSSFIIYTALSSALIKKLFIIPLQELTESVSSADLRNNEISGIERSDEIGDLAKTMKKTWKRLNENNETLMAALNDRDHRDQLLHTINIVAAILLDSDIPQFERGLYRSMGMMAATVDADRVYIWKNSMYNGELCATQIYEWSERAEPQQGKDYTINISYREKLPIWGELLSKGQCINSLAIDLHSSWLFFTSAGVLSIFLAPIFLRDDFWGFIGFDNCHRQSKFSENEAAILHSGCMMIASAFLRHNYITEIVDLQANLKEALKETQTASRAKSAFLAHMSHEIRTPMNSIVGFSELAIDDNISAKTKDYLGKIINNAQWLLQIINDVLDLSKIESGKMELENIPFNLDEIFSNCKTLIMPKAAEKGIQLHFSVETPTGILTLGDPTRLRQVFVNLLSNAVKFTNIGVVKALAEVRKKTESAVTIYFEVNDSGIGMTEEQIEKIFEPFTQAETGTTRQYGGTGLGLSITYNILELMGGRLSVDSKPGLGSKFSFILVLDTIPVKEDETYNKNILNIIEKPVFNGEILLCEDNLLNQQVICEHLTRIGLKTVVAENGKIGIDIIKNRVKNSETLFDLILMDMHMPVMDGLEASAEILKMETGIPIIALTANIMSSDRELYRKNGIYNCIGKPFTSQELWRCLLKYLKPVNTNNKNLQSDNLDTDEEFNKKLKIMFLKSNKNKFSEILHELENDIKKAHRTAHTLKSNAGQIGKYDLQSAAEKIESGLAKGYNNVTEEQLSLLETELNNALAEFSLLLNEELEVQKLNKNISGKKLNKDESEAGYALRILDEVQPLLKMGNPESCRFIESISDIQGNAEVEELKNKLIQQIDDFEFDLSLITFNALKEEIIKTL